MILAKIGHAIDNGINAVANGFQAAGDGIENFLFQKIAAPMFTDSNIFHALNGRRLQAEKEQNQNLGIIGKVARGIVVGARAFVPTGIVAGLGTIIACGCFGMRLSFVEPNISWTKAVITAPLKEEIVFRGLIQNGIGYAQKVLDRNVPNCLKDTSLIRGVTSSTARILATSSIFALCHYGVTYMSPAQNMGQMSAIALMPSLSILYETTGSLFATIPAHAAFNAIGMSLYKAGSGLRNIP